MEYTRCADAATEAMDPSVSPPSPKEATEENDAPTRSSGGRMKIDPEGALARGRSYTSFTDDYYNSTSTWGSGSSLPVAPTDAAAVNTSSIEPSAEDAATCVPNYLMGIIETMAVSEKRVQAIAVDSQVGVRARERKGVEGEAEHRGSRT